MDYCFDFLMEGLMGQEKIDIFISYRGRKKIDIFISYRGHLFSSPV
jgi:hypothetical protein